MMEEKNVKKLKRKKVLLSAHSSFNVQLLLLQDDWFVELTVYSSTNENDKTLGRKTLCARKKKPKQRRREFPRTMQRQ